MGNLIKVETYDGTLEGAKLALKNLNVQDDFYHFNIRTGNLVLIRCGIVLRPGDSYQFRSVD